MSKRLTFLSLMLVITNALWGCYFFASGSEESLQSFTNEFPLVDPARNFIPQSDYIVNLQPLREKLLDLSSNLTTEQVSIYIEFLNTGANISINPDTYIWPASLTKVPLALAAMKKVERGEWDLANELVLMPGDADDKSGDLENPLAEYPIGTRFTIEQLLEELLVKSDNTAYFILLRNVHKDDLKGVIEGIGIESLFSEEGKVSAKEYSRILRSLYTASYLDREGSEKILSLLDESEFNDFLSYSVYDSVPFPHKYGEYIPYNAYSDSGIVYIPNRPVLISVMFQGNEKGDLEEERAKAQSFMRTVFDETYSYLTAYETK